MGFSDSMGSIILVEDDSAVRVMMEQLLTSKGYRVETFPSAESSIERMDRGNSISLVIIDVQLPGMDGIDLADWVGDHHPGVPIMFMSGDPHKVTKPGYLVLPKPVNNAEFLNHVWQHVKMGQMSMGFRELKSDFVTCIDKVSEVADEVKNVNNNLTSYIKEAADARSKQDAVIMSIGAKAEAAHRAADAANNNAANANTNASNAHVKVDNLTLGTVTKNWKDKLDPVSLLLMTLMTGVICWFITSYKDDLIEKATGVDKKIKSACEPIQNDIKKTHDQVDAIDRSLARQDMKISELDRGQAAIDHKMDKILWRLNVPPDVPVMRSVPPTKITTH